LSSYINDLFMEPRGVPAPISLVSSKDADKQVKDEVAQ
jgi:hypothetical protein